VSRRQNVCKPSGEGDLLGGVGVERRPDAVGQESLDPANLAPCRKRFRFVQELLDQNLMIAFQKNRLMALAPRDEQIENIPGVRAPVDIVPQKDVHGPGRGIRLQVGVNPREHLRQQIGAAVYIADGIHTQALRDLRQLSLAL
jgi:hypothetical protein